MSSALEKAMSVLEFMVTRPEGCAVSDIAAGLGLPPSGVHRMLKELEKIGYVRQRRDMGDYELTVRLAALGLSWLGQTGIPDVAEPILDALAHRAQELARLALADGGALMHVSAVQGVRRGLRYDPGLDQGEPLHLASSAGGQAWLAAMDDDDALAAALGQGLVKPEAPGPEAPRSAAELLEILRGVRARGWARNANSYHDGMAAMAAVIRRPEGVADAGAPVGVVSLAGPSVRFTPERMEALAPDLLDAAEELGQASRATSWFCRGAERARAG
ncbi:IclR family transcriptional regulator [Rhodovulum sp. DZ06]|uniref:IclR family transcriptional regulator n=1 Tax=Rhodovulum sp. DZ06 TaxID=3425126 RepID=UPI003D3575DB